MRRPVVFAVAVAGGFEGGSCVGWRLRSVEDGAVVGVGVDVVVVAVVVVVDIWASSISLTSSGCRSLWTRVPAVEITLSSTIGLANNSFHSSSPSTSSVSSSLSSARASSSSRRLCIRFRSCLSRAISACASCLRSSGFSCGSERSSWERRVRAYSTFYSLLWSDLTLGFPYEAQRDSAYLGNSHALKL